jgi:hypothetical protein
MEHGSMNEHAGLDDEADSRDYLREHPAQEAALWMDWVLTVCRRRKMAPPTGVEWDTLMRQWHHGKAPLTSVDELQALRRL